jgi:hypothetical protein
MQYQKRKEISMQYRKWTKIRTFWFTIYSSFSFLSAKPAINIKAEKPRYFSRGAKRIRHPRHCRIAQD